MFRGEHIRGLRAEKKLSLVELAEKAGVSVSYLSEIERGRKVPSLKMVDKLCEALNISSREFMQEEGTSNGQCIHLGQRIRMHREEKSLTQSQLAQLSGLSLSYVCEVENGNVFPSVNALNKIAGVLEVPVKNLMASPGSLGKKLRSVREEQGLTQSKLANMTGFSPGLIGQLEQGKVQPSLKTVEKLSEALNISPCYLVAEEDEQRDLLHLLSPEVRELLLEPNVQSVLRMLRDCSEEEARFILDFIQLFKHSEICK